MNRKRPLPRTSSALMEGVVLDPRPFDARRLPGRLPAAQRAARSKPRSLAGGGRAPAQFAVVSEQSQARFVFMNSQQHARRIAVGSVNNPRIDRHGKIPLPDDEVGFVTVDAEQYFWFARAGREGAQANLVFSPFHAN